jgi:hypothetical protein
MNEKQWQAQVVALAKSLGWIAYHTHDSRRSAAGFPDLVLAHPERGIIFVELKTANGKLSEAQTDWLMMLAVAVESGDTLVTVWRPADLEAEVIPALAGKPSPSALTSNEPTTERLDP